VVYIVGFQQLDKGIDRAEYGTGIKALPRAQRIADKGKKTAIYQGCSIYEKECFHGYSLNFISTITQLTTDWRSRENYYP
jgi:hypothetical protein